MSHYYDPKTAEARYFVPKKDGSGNRPTTIRDAKANGWVPSVTEILKLLRKPALEEWLIRTAVEAVCAAPDIPGEGIDAKITRILDVRREQDEQSQIARDRGTELHAAIEDYFQGRTIAPEIEPWVAPAIKAIRPFGEVVATEKILVGDGYAGKTDLILKGPQCWWLFDYKTSKKLPKADAYPEHQLQLGAYAMAFAGMQRWQDSMHDALLPIRTCNVYISTLEQGQFRICENQEWERTYEDGFAPLVRHWQWACGYKPEPHHAETQRRD